MQTRHSKYVLFQIERYMDKCIMIFNINFFYIHVLHWSISFIIHIARSTDIALKSFITMQGEQLMHDRHSVEWKGDNSMPHNYGSPITLCLSLVISIVTDFNMRHKLYWNTMINEDLLDDFLTNFSVMSKTSKHLFHDDKTTMCYTHVVFVLNICIV